MSGQKLFNLAVLRVKIFNFQHYAEHLLLVSLLSLQLNVKVAAEVEKQLSTPIVYPSNIHKSIVTSYADNAAISPFKHSACLFVEMYERAKRKTKERELFLLMPLFLFTRLPLRS